MREHFAWLVLPQWTHWLAYVPVAWMAVLLCLAWPAELLIERLAAGLAPGHVGEWPDDYNHLELAQLVEEDYAAVQATGLEVLRSLSFL